MTPALEAETKKVVASIKSDLLLAPPFARPGLLIGCLIAIAHEQEIELRELLESVREVWRQCTPENHL